MGKNSFRAFLSVSPVYFRRKLENVCLIEGGKEELNVVCEREREREGNVENRKSQRKNATNRIPPMEGGEREEIESQTSKEKRPRLGKKTNEID